MIQQLSTRYQKAIAIVLLTVFYTSSLLTAAYGSGRPYFTIPASYKANNTWSRTDKKIVNKEVVNFEKGEKHIVKSTADHSIDLKQINTTSHFKTNIGGPSQPEMSTFKSVGSNNLVNLFTGDFSYNIPLLDVGGYPVNIFYDGGVGMEQEASWVGLGWNINPGNINRNMRGVPDDFDGNEVLTQTQAMKKNRTWGLTGGFDVELIGIDKTPFASFAGSAGASLGVSFNNYLGPALELGIKGNTALSISGKAKAEKSAPGLKAGGSIGITGSSRNGVSFTPSVSLTATASNQAHTSAFGFGFQASTSYNSRIGIKAIQIAEQMSYNTNSSKTLGRLSNYASDNKLYSFSSNLTFTKPTYIPSIRMPLTNTAYAGRFEDGFGVFGVKGSQEYEVYKQVSQIDEKYQTQIKPLIGFLYLEKSKGNPNAVVDFTRLNDNEVTEKTPIISAPQYAYDVFSIQGEGTGGSFRAYRNDLGYVRDNYTSSHDLSVTVGADIGPPGHYGASVAIIKTPTTIGEWNVGNKLQTALGFKSAAAGAENVYFRNPGETSVLADQQYGNIGNTDLVRFKLGGSDANPTIEPVLERFSRLGNLTTTVDQLEVANTMNTRKKRSQVISFLTAAEASVIGLDTKIKSYRSDNILTNGILNCDLIERCGNCGALNDPNNYRKSNHISQINVTEANGQRYIYGIPVYNIKQKDFTFTIQGKSVADAENDITGFNASETTLLSDALKNNAYEDGYLNITETPAYAHSFLLSGLLSPDYVDVTNDGITEDDLGTAVKFNYTRIKNNEGSWAKSKWRTPLTNDMQANYANFSPGKRTETKDDKGIISYGERESWYTHSIESKSMIAIFTLEDRQDGKAALNELSGLDISDKTSKRLKKIDLYNKSDLKKNGISNASPIKTVHFEYSYDLCSNYPANSGVTENSTGLPITDFNAQHGKLTLQKIYFTYNGQDRAIKSQYVFDYGSAGSTTGNPAYAFNASDRWGTYKPVSPDGTQNAPFPQTVRNADHPYSYQSDYPGNNNGTEITKKATIDNYASAWMLKKILLPSGGQMEVQYESDDYAFVQNKRAAVMMQLDGLGNSEDYSQKTNNLYDIKGIRGVNGLLSITENNYAFIRVPMACANAAEVKAKYLEGMNQLSFKLVVNMPKGQEHLNSYANIKTESLADAANYGVVSSNHNIIWVKLELVDDKSPLSLTAIEFLREQLPGQAFKYSDVSGETGLVQAVHVLFGMLGSFGHAFDDPVKTLRGNGRAQSVDLTKCFVRLNDPDGYKYGGGYRVKSVRLKDNWQKMTNQYTSEYGQDYNYETTEVFNGQTRTISSGVASYEPSMGGDENPFQTMYQVENTVPLGPTSYGAIEMPVLDAFFPSPIVGYSKVTVQSIRKGTAIQKSKSAVGKQVTEFYTAKDYPVYYSNTPLDAASDLKANSSSFSAFFWKYAFDSRAISQGFLVVTNDMHGKMKTQASYMENDDKTPINRTTNFYSNTGATEGGDDFDFIYAADGGIIKKGKMGIDIELMTDTREFSVKSKTSDFQAQVNAFPYLGLGPWFPFPWATFGASENTYRAVTTTKVISYHSVLTSVEVIDKGSQVSTNNFLFDAETGNVVVNKTKNEFKQTIYSTNYPSYWAYSGMGLAYKNIDASFGGLNFSDGKLLNLPDQNSIFESGDELMVTKQSAIPAQPVTPKISGTVSYACSATNNGQGSVTLAFNFLNPTPAGLRIYVAFIYQDNEGYGWGGVALPAGTTLVGSSNPYYIDIPAGVTSYATPFPSLNSAGQFWPCFDGLPNNSQLYKKDIFLKVNSPSNYIMDLSLTTPGLTLHNDISNVVPAASQQPCNIESPDLMRLWVFDKNKDLSSLTNPAPEYYFMDSVGRLYTKSDVSLKIVRSGKRNMLGASAASVTSMANPIIGDQILINADSKAVNAGAVEFKEKWQTDNELFKTYKVIPELNTGCSTEVEDCNGYLEKHINPYVKGLLGTFRAGQSKVFYGSRNETDPLVNTKISSNGYLNNFNPYWVFNLAKNLTPATGTTSWVWNSQITKINSKGLELETENALGIYTAAQYGFNKTVPLSVANNSRYQQMFNEGFEDDGYDETLNGATVNLCLRKHIDFSGLNNSSIVSLTQDGLRAHSGKKMLSVNGQVVKVLNTTSVFNDDYNLTLEGDITKTLSDIGGTPGQATFEGYSSLPSQITNPGYNGDGSQANVGGIRVQYNGNTNAGTSYGTHSFDVHFSYYINVAVSGTYNFTPYVSYDLDDVNLLHNYKYTQSLFFTIHDVNHNKIGDDYYVSPALSTAETGSTSKIIPINLCQGIYLVEGYYESYLEPFQSPDGSIPNIKFLKYFLTNNVGSQCYKTLSTVDGCTYTKPIPATIQMQNPIFSMPADKKMQFSAWVHEVCTDAVCPQTSFTKSNIEIWSDGVKLSTDNSHITQTGSIIEGWQKVEGDFILPANASSSEIRFINTKTVPMYVDDIRIHPYNANMKSYVYDPINLRLSAELDENNYAKFYEYDEEGTLVRTKAETKAGIKTITETRSANQKTINSF